MVFTKIIIVGVFTSATEAFLMGILKDFCSKSAQNASSLKFSFELYIYRCLKKENKNEFKYGYNQDQRKN